VVITRGSNYLNCDVRDVVLSYSIGSLGCKFFYWRNIIRTLIFSKLEVIKEKRRDSLKVLKMQADDAVLSL